jgi:hypothetical protein
MTIGIEEAKKDLIRIIGETILNNAETIIVAKESLRLLNDKKSLSALLHGHEMRDSCCVPNGKTLNEAFHDLY